MLPKMTAEELRTSIPALWTAMTTGEGRFASLFQADRNAVRAYTLDRWDTEPEPGEQRVTLSTPRISVDLATHLLTQHPPTINFRYLKDSEKNRSLAQLQENFVLGVLRRNELERGDAIVEAVAFSIALYNRAIVRCLYLEPKARGDVSFPFWLQPLNPSTVIYQAAGANIDWVLVHDPQKPLADIVSTFGESVATALGKNRPEDLSVTVPWYEYWDKEYRVYLTTEGPTRDQFWHNKVKHNYGCVPFAIGDATVPIMSATDAAAGGFLAPILDTWQNQCKIASIVQQYVHDTVRHIRWVKTKFGKDFDVESYAKTGWIPLATDEDIGSLPIPPLPAAANQLIQMYQADMDRATFASIMYGGGAMPSSGRLASLLRASNEASLVPMQKALQRCIAQLARIIIRIMENKVKEDKVFVFGYDRRGKRFDLAASGKEVGGPCDVDVDIDWELEEDKMSREAHGLALLQGGALGLREYLEHYRKVPDVEKSAEDIRKSIPLTHPAYKEWYTQRYIAALQAKIDQTIQKDAQAQWRRQAREFSPPPQEPPVPPPMGQEMTISQGPQIPQVPQMPQGPQIPQGPQSTGVAGGMSGAFSPPSPEELPVPPTEEELMAMMER